jgi:amino acid transporter
LINASFAMGNIQIATIGAGEVSNPRVNVPKAMRRIFIRIFLFYIMSLLSVGLILDSNDARMATKSGTSSSPFVLAFTNMGIKVVPSIINAVVITSAFSAGNGMVFLASRVLVGLAQDGNAPQYLLKTNKYGVPWAAVLTSFPLGLLCKCR